VQLGRRVTVIEPSNRRSTDSGSAGVAPSADSGTPPRDDDRAISVLLVHNYYQQAGGEDQVFADEAKLLRERGHRVFQHSVHNSALEGMGRVELARKTVWNGAAYDEIRQIIRRDRPAVAHFHNTFPLLSPAVYQACRDEGVKVVQTLHNFRFFCPAATFFRDGHVCEDCMRTSTPWPAVVHACYRNNRAASAVSALMLTYHRLRRTYRDDVDVYLALTEFSRRKVIEGGLPADKVLVKPNFVSEDPGEGRGTGDYAVFVGRLAPEKGIVTLLKAWQSQRPPIRLKIVGDGPLRPLVEASVRECPDISYLGLQSLSQVHAIVGDAQMLVFCSEWYETFGRTIVEAFASGTPVVASAIGGVPELVQDGVTGRLFRLGDPTDLAAKVSEICRNDAESRQRMRRSCRKEFLDKFTAARNYPMLLRAYRCALGAAAADDPCAPAVVPASENRGAAGVFTGECRTGP
jgi:glycosyltransferase involved in cell wall biosynthesis